jgi:hypothetical protein
MTSLTESSLKTRLDRAETDEFIDDALVEFAGVSSVVKNQMFAERLESLLNQLQGPLELSNGIFSFERLLQFVGDPRRSVALPHRLCVPNVKRTQLQNNTLPWLFPFNKIIP